MRNGLLAFLLIATQQCYASWLYVDAGLLGHNAFYRVSQQSDGSKTLLGTVYLPQAGVTLRWCVETLCFLPRASYSLLSLRTLGLTDSNEQAFSSVLLSAGYVSVEASPFFDIHAGPGLMSYTIQGKGGSSTLKNGTTEDRFANPGRTVTTQSFFLGAGFGVHVDRIRVDLDFILGAPFSSTRATWNVLMSMGLGIL